MDILRHNNLLTEELDKVRKTHKAALSEGRKVRERMHMLEEVLGYVQKTEVGKQIVDEYRESQRRAKLTPEERKAEDNPQQEDEPDLAELIKGWDD